MTAVPVELPIRVLLADPHALFRRGVRLVLEDEPDIEVVGEAGEGLDAVERIVELVPDLVLMDVRMPGVSGIEATRRVRELVPSVKVAILTVSEEDDDLFAAVRGGRDRLPAQGGVDRGAARGRTRGRARPQLDLALDGVASLGEFNALSRRVEDRDGTRPG